MSQPPTYDFLYSNNSLSIRLNNNGAILDSESPSVSKYFKGAQYFKVSTVVTFDTSYADFYKVYGYPDDQEVYKYPDVHICLNVPLQRELKDNDELYLGCSFPLGNINYTKFWIPALEWGVGSQYRDPISEIEENGFSEEIKLKNKYHLTGISFFNFARISLRNDNKNNCSIFCESKFDAN